MSLWKVDDAATQLLMTRFYKNLLSGKTKTESLSEAQKYVRDYEIEVTDYGKRPLTAKEKEQAYNRNTETTVKKIHPYANPYFWAAFVLLDAND